MTSEIIGFFPVVVKTHFRDLGDFHSGFRVYRRKVLEVIPFEKNSNDFVFDSEFLAQAAYHGFRIGDAPVPVRYFPEASSIDFLGSLRYGFKTLGVLGKYFLHKWNIIRCPLFAKAPSQTIV